MTRTLITFIAVLLGSTAAMAQPQVPVMIERTTNPEAAILAAQGDEPAKELLEKLSQALLSVSLAAR